jgi:hypothetical protein
MDDTEELEGWTKGSAKVQIGAELLCKSAKVRLNFRSRVSAVGSQIQVFRCGYRFGT